MAKRSSTCSICENANLPSLCAACTNYRLNSYNTLLTSLRTVRESLHLRMNEALLAKGRMNDQINWQMFHSEKLTKMNDKLHFLEKSLSEAKAELVKRSNDLKARYELLQSSISVLERARQEQLEKLYSNLIATQRLGHMSITSQLLVKQSAIVKQICKLFPQNQVKFNSELKDGFGFYDQICNACLPRGLDPHSVPSEELSASLGYMIQILNLLVRVLAAPALHNAGFAGSCSRIWQRNSYWDARPSSRSNEYPLFIPRQDSCSSIRENSWSQSNSSNFGVISVGSEGKYVGNSVRSNSFNASSGSAHSMEMHKDLQKGISLLKKSTACVTAYFYSSLGLESPDASTFDALSKLLAFLASSKDLLSSMSIKMACSRLGNQDQNPKSSMLPTSSSFLESTRTSSVMKSRFSNHVVSSAGGIICANGMTNSRNMESLIEGWDLVEYAPLPPRPSEIEDIEHWTRAMFVDATRR